MRILVTGGAGYVGSHCVRALLRQGHEVWVYDNLSCGHRQAVPEASLIEGDLADVELLRSTMERTQAEAVVHFAAVAEVGESVVNPAKYYANNVIGTLNLLNAMRGAGVRRIVFSSTTATYGEPERVPIPEDEPQRPISPYGFTKLVIERALEDYARAYGFGYAALRYFNAAGASPDGDIGEDHKPESHLIPITLQVALGQRSEITVFGDDYPTPDGTCIRDYVHVDDLADAHLRALDRLVDGQGIKVNLGSGNGYSVREVIDTCRKASGHAIPVRLGQRRPGDPPRLIADASRARRELGWEPRYRDIASIVATAWHWHSSHPQGYE
ncbi:MAG: UDP-glucose 4-epimerase GalE [Planctomycetes bacterium]|nr:UDP-glucose 4-epimerase GalE [Planctomycetota bacterium]